MTLPRAITVRPLLLGVVVLAVCLSGCTESEPDPGTLTGHVTLTVGPPTPDGKPTLRHSPARNWQVSIRDGNGAWTTHTDDEGMYTFSLAPGDYTVSCSDGPAVHVAADMTATVDCNVYVP